MKRRKEWFEHMALYQALWWVPVGHRPTVAEGMARIAMIELSPLVLARALEPFPQPLLFVRPDQVGTDVGFDLDLE